MEEETRSTNEEVVDVAWGSLRSIKGHSNSQSSFSLIKGHKRWLHLD